VSFKDAALLENEYKEYRVFTPLNPLNFENEFIECNESFLDVKPLPIDFSL
jgi:hypothetical protein